LVIPLEAWPLNVNVKLEIPQVFHNASNVADLLRVRYIVQIVESTFDWAGQFPMFTEKLAAAVE